MIMCERPAMLAAGSPTVSSASSGQASKLLFGEIDASSVGDSTSSVARTKCTVVLSTNRTFLSFWHSDKCRERFLYFLDPPDLASLRLVSLDLSARIAPRCFGAMTCTFRVHSFAKRSRIQALERIGHHVQTLTLILPYKIEHMLPPLIEVTGEEKKFTYTPVQPDSRSSRQARVREPKYGDWETTDLLVRQYPPLFHAAANSACFTRCIAALPHLSRLIIKGQGDDFHVRAHHRSISDFALISLCAALDQTAPHALTRISLRDLPTSAMKYLTPRRTTESAVSDWCSRITHVDAAMKSIHVKPSDQPDELAIVQSHLRNFRRLETLSFEWSGTLCPFPFTLPRQADLRPLPPARNPRRPPAHPAFRKQVPWTLNASQERRPAVRLPRLESLHLRNMTTSAMEVHNLLRENERLRTIDFKDVALQSGTWEEAFRPLTRARRISETETGHVPIMLAKDDVAAPPEPALKRLDSAIFFTPPRVASPESTLVPGHADGNSSRKVCFAEVTASVEPETLEKVRRSPPQQRRSEKTRRRDVWGDVCVDLMRMLRRGGRSKWPRKSEGEGG